MEGLIMVIENGIRLDQYEIFGMDRYLDQANSLEWEVSDINTKLKYLDESNEDYFIRYKHLNNKLVENEEELKYLIGQVQATYKEILHYYQ